MATNCKVSYNYWQAGTIYNSNYTIPWRLNICVEIVYRGGCSHQSIIEVSTLYQSSIVKVIDNYILIWNWVNVR